MTFKRLAQPAFLGLAALLFAGSALAAACCAPSSAAWSPICGQAHVGSASGAMQPAL